MPLLHSNNHIDNASVVNWHKRMPKWHALLSFNVSETTSSVWVRINVALGYVKSANEPSL